MLFALVKIKRVFIIIPGMVSLLITGHSRGLGYSLMQQCLKAGHRVLGLSRTPASGLPKQRGLGLQQVSIDLSDRAALTRFLESSALEDFFSGSQQAILVNNAGLLGPIGFAGALQDTQIFDSIAVNVAAAIAITNRFLSVTENCKDRRVAHISSGAGRSAYAGWGVYCASKAALDHHARCLAIEHAGGLRIESLAPGIIDTQMQAQIRAASLDQFPMRPKFDALKESGALASAESVGIKLLEHLLSPDFGSAPCTDLRNS